MAKKATTKKTTKKKRIGRPKGKKRVTIECSLTKECAAFVHGKIDNLVASGQSPSRAAAAGLLLQKGATRG